MEQTGCLKKLNPRDGWLAERWRTGTKEPQGEVRTARLAKQPRRAKPAPYLQYKGDRHDAFWYFDREMAERTRGVFIRQERDLLPQYVSFMQEGELVPYTPQSHVTLSARFLPEADGVTFHLKAVYTDSLRASLTDGHSAAVPRIERICGPVKQVNDTTFVLDFYRMGTTNKKRTRVSRWWQVPAETGNIRSVYRNSALTSLPSYRGAETMYSFSRYRGCKSRNGIRYARCDIRLRAARVLLCKGRSCGNQGE